jgi:CRP/FNR family transcriptional regulator, cyclic AMP receptor protein
VNARSNLRLCKETISIGEMNLSDNQLDPLYGKHPAAMHIMGKIIPDERILKALHNSRLVENLRDFEVSVFASLLTVQYFEVKELVAELDDSLKDALMILVEGEVEVSAMVGNESVLLHLTAPGDMARIISFVGGNIVDISARIKIKKDSAVLLLQRSKLETLLHTQPSIVYCVMRNLIQHVHAVARRKNAENAEMSNYIYRVNGRY